MSNNETNVLSGDISNLGKRGANGTKKIIPSLLQRRAMTAVLLRLLVVVVAVEESVALEAVLLVTE